MNELKQMMLDLQKNENKESESYPNVSFMPMDNFEGMTLKRHERRKKLRRDIYQKKQDTNKRYIKNLSNLELTQAQITLVSRGVKFIPTPVTNESHIRT